MRTAILPEAVTLYLDDIEAAGRSPLTVQRYRYILTTCFQRFLFPNQLDIRDFLETIPSRNTRCTSLVVLRQFYRWAVQRGILSEDPTVGIPIPKATRRPWPLVTEEEFTSACRFLDEMMVLMATIFYRVGSRVGETCAMRADQVAFEGDYGVIDFPLRKGGEAGFAAFGPEVATLLRPWVTTHSGWVFPLRMHLERHIRSGQAGNNLAQAGRRAGLTAPFCAHRLRYSYITSAVDSGWNQLALQQQVGHRNPGSTAWYYKPTRQGLLRALKGSRRVT